MSGLASTPAQQRLTMSVAGVAPAPASLASESMSIVIWAMTNSPADTSPEMLVKGICCSPSPVAIEPRTARRHLRGARRSDAASDPRPSCSGRGLGDRAGRPLRHQPAGNLQTPQRAGARRAHLPRTRRPAAAAPARAQAAPARAQAARGSHRVAGDLPPILGRQFRKARRRARGAEGAEEAWTQQEIEETRP